MIEWGLSLHAESHRGNEVRNILVDFGYNPVTLLTNMEILKIKPEKFDAFVLSHGHYDHFGGLVGFLSATKGRPKKDLPFFVGGEDCFCTRTATSGGQFGALDRQAIKDSNLMLMMAEGPASLPIMPSRQGRSLKAPLKSRFGPPARKLVSSTASVASRKRSHPRRIPESSLWTTSNTKSGPISC